MRIGLQDTGRLQGYGDDRTWQGYKGPALGMRRGSNRIEGRLERWGAMEGSGIQSDGWRVKDDVESAERG